MVFRNHFKINKNKKTIVCFIFGNEDVFDIDDFFVFDNEDFFVSDYEHFFVFEYEDFFVFDDDEDFFVFDNEDCFVFDNEIQNLFVPKSTSRRLYTFLELTMDSRVGELSIRCTV